jgi:hypothetical protein
MLIAPPMIALTMTKMTIKPTLRSNSKGLS